MKSNIVAVLGDINIDIIMNVPAYPSPGGDALVYENTLRTGGSVANTAIMLARLGVSTEIYSCTGDDDWANIAFNKLRAEGVDLEHVRRDSHAGTGLIFIPVTPDGERTMFSYRGANVLLGPDEITEPEIGKLGALHLSGYSFLKSPQREAAWKAIEIAQKLRVPITLDLGVEPAAALGADLPRLLCCLELIVLGDQEVEVIAGTRDLQSGIAHLLDLGVQTIGLKLGKDGCEVIRREDRARLPGLRVDVVDTTGAGDAFSAGMIYGGLRDLSLGARGMLSNTFGALATTVWGGGAALPSLDQAFHFLQQQQFDPPVRPYQEEALAALERCIASAEKSHD